MPRKQVYGKRAPAMSLFSNILDSSSPEQLDVNAPRRRRMPGEKRAAKKTETELKDIKNERIQEAEVAKQEAVKTQGHEDTALGDIENQMESLKLEAADTEARSKESSKEKKARKALRTKDANSNPVATEGIKQKRRIKPTSVIIPVDTESHNEVPVEIALKEMPLAEQPLDALAKLAIRPKSSHENHQVQAQAAILPKQHVEDKYTHIRPLLDLCSDPAARQAPTPFSSWSSKLEPHFDVSKIAEASYGEVYRLSLKSSIPGFTKADESVLKIMALKPSPELCPIISEDGTMSKADLARQGKIGWMSSPASVLSEVQLLQLMTPIPGFTNFRELRILEGRPAPAFVTAWKAWNKSKIKGEKSVFPDPSRKANYDENQLWAVVEMQDAGCDLENIELRDIWSVWDVFWGVALAIGKGEKGVRFEHRDLHLGNICIRSCRSPSEDAENTDPASALTAQKIRNTHRKLGFTGLETTIIDYTLSRADIADSPAPAVQDVAFLDLEADPAIFSADATYEYQYEIYRHMRSAIYYGRPLAFTSPDPLTLPAHLLKATTWREFHPITNLIWLHFLLHKLLENVVWPSSDPELEITLARVDGKVKRAERRARKIERALVALRDMLDPEVLGDHGDERGVASVGELVAVALVEGWLGEEDVVGIAGEGSW